MPVERRVLRALVTGKTWATPTAVAHRTGVDLDTTRAVLATLVKEGHAASVHRSNAPSYYRAKTTGGTR